VSELSFAPSIPPAERERLERALGHRFASEELLVEALTHRSFAKDRRLDVHNERLEFLGDAVLGLTAAEWLFRRHVERPEGELSRAKAVLASEGPLAGYAAELDLGSVVRLGENEARTGGRSRASVLADALEALFGAVHLDGGAAAARAVVERYLAWAEPRVEWQQRDAKTRLQEWAQARGSELPSYAIVEASGPDHQRTFVCEVSVLGNVRGKGVASTKKEAHQRAAAAALAQLEAPGALPDGRGLV
jgi:ribonuclease-3